MEDYKRDIHPFWNRVKTAWYALTTKEYIFIEVERKEVEGNALRTVWLTYRTSDNSEGDLLTIKAAYFAKEAAIIKEKEAEKVNIKQ